MTVTFTATPMADEARTRGAAAQASAATRGQTGAASNVPEIVDVWGRDSFPASDPPANW
jgi:hypothetical protein